MLILAPDAGKYRNSLLFPARLAEAVSSIQGRHVIGAAMLAAIAVLAMLTGCSPAPEPAPKPARYASAEQVEMNFRGKTFVLGDNDAVAILRRPGWPKDRWLRLPFWLGIDVLVPGVLQPKEGHYYVISEARLIKPLKRPGQWIIEAGSALIKKEAVLITTKTDYLSRGKLLPTIVQFAGMRAFEYAGAQVRLPVLREVSLPMKWTLGGAVPPSYARFRVEGQLPG